MTVHSQSSRPLHGHTRFPSSAFPPARNHFALDLGVDRDDLVGSLDAFAEGVERVIDVAEVNGRLFLNNVSLGIYGDAVQQPSGMQLSASGSPPGKHVEPENAEAADR